MPEVMPAYLQVTPIRPHAIGSEEDKEYCDRTIRMASDQMIAELDPSHPEPRRMIGVYSPIRVVLAEDCCNSDEDPMERNPATVCEICTESWQADYLVALFRHGTLRGVSYGCICKACMAVPCILHPGDILVTSSDMPDGGPGTYPEE